jgi:hypothetical protein
MSGNGRKGGGEGAQKAVGHIAGITYSFSGHSSMGSSESAIELKIIGDDLVRTKAIADDVKARMEKSRAWSI